MPISTTPPPRATAWVAAALLVLAAACSDNPVSVDDDPATASTGVRVEPPADLSDWAPATHEKRDPDYNAVFAPGVVQRIDLTIAPDNWQAMWNDMTEKYGPFGSGRGGRPDDGAENPIWAPATLVHEGTTWYQVGVRFKGNSSLVSTWSRGIGKLALKLDFDEFEDLVPEIENQRFYGFKQLALANGFEDASLMREQVTADLFREAGVPAARTAFCRVYVDHGEGPAYFGLYTLVEVVDDTVIETQFDDDGNLYKPEGAGASFAAGSFDEASFQKKTNEDEAEWSDVLALFDALHAPARTTDPAAWRAGLDTAFDTDGFLRWLAVNTVIQNWDSYGKMTHNYYLYNDPSTGRLSWIPWDHNEALKTGKMGGALSLGLSEVGSSWPLIRYLIDDPTYRTRYTALVVETVSGVFEPTAVADRYRAAHALIQPYATGSEGERDGYTFLSSPGAFDAALDDLIAHAAGRSVAVQAYVQAQ